MALAKWGTVRANSQLVKSTDEFVRIYNDQTTDLYVESLVLGVGEMFPPAGLSSVVRGYGLGGDGAGTLVVTTGLWPDVNSDVLTVVDAASSYGVTMTGGVLTIDDLGADADFAVMNPNSVLIVDE